MANEKKPKTGSAPKTKTTAKVAKPRAAGAKSKPAVKPKAAAAAKPAKAAKPAQKPKSGKKRVGLIAGAAALVVVCGTLGVLWGIGVFGRDPGNTTAIAVDFISTLEGMESTPTHELAGTYTDHDGNGNLHLLYKSGSIKSMFIELLTTPELRTNLNGGGAISFSKGEVSTTTVGNGISRSVTISSEHSHGFKVGLEVGTGEKSPVQVKFSTEQTNEWTLGQSSTNEFNSYVNVESSINTAETHSTPLSECEIGMYYAYAAYADFDVYIDVEVELSENTITVVSSKASYGMSQRVSIVFVSSPNNNFAVPDDMTLDALPIIDYIDIADIFPDGSGTAEDPYCIYSVSQLMSMALMPNKAYKLQNDLNMQHWKWINPIDFGGTLDGNGKVIRNFSIVREAQAYTADISYLGLFRRISGSISNLTLSDCEIANTITDYGWVRTANDAAARGSADQGSGRLYAGILAGELSSGGLAKDVTLCTSKVTVNRFQSVVGGIFGHVHNAQLQNCKAEGVAVKGDGDLGVLAGGTSGGTLMYCSVDSRTDIQGVTTMSSIFYLCLSEQQSVGGLLGWSYKGTVTSNSVKNVHFTFNGGGDRPGVKGGYAPNIGTLIGKATGPFHINNTTMIQQELNEKLVANNLLKKKR